MIADYLHENGIDEYDEYLRGTNQFTIQRWLHRQFKKSINLSSNMLVVVSPSIKYSNWIPFEIVFGFDKTELAVLIIKKIEKGKLPSYLKTTN